MSMAQWDAATDRMFSKVDDSTIRTVTIQLRTYADSVWSKRREIAFPENAGWTPTPAELRDWREQVARDEMRAAHEVADALQRDQYRKDIDRALLILSGRYTEAAEGSEA